MVGQRVTKQGVRAAAQAVDQLRRPKRDTPPRPGGRTPSSLAIAIAEIASRGRPTEQQIDELRAQFPTVAVVDPGDPHGKVALTGPEWRAFKGSKYDFREAWKLRPQGDKRKKRKKPKKDYGG